MKIGIISDTHGNTNAVDEILSLVPDAKLWLHAGDLVPDAVYLEQTYNVGVAKVAGNCDWFGGDVPEETVVEVAGHKIFLTHGHIYGARLSANLIVAVAKEAGCDMAVYGHTHVAVTAKVEGENFWLLNPGSASRPRDENRPSFIVAELNPDAQPQINLFRLENKKK